jgi:hypothetical protein
MTRNLTVANLVLKFQPELFTGVALNEYNSYGTWLSGCGKYFMFSAKKVS